jgi:transcription initiation factor IIE alpha subunit
VDHFFDKQSLDFNCPNCDRRITKTVAELKRPGQKCPHCGAVMETSGFKRGIDEADRQMEQFDRQLGNIKIDLKL